MEQKHELDITPDKLLAEVRMLRKIVSAMLVQFPDQAIDSVVGHLEWTVECNEQRVRDTQNDRWRDYAAVAYDMLESIKVDTDEYMADRAEGHRRRTIQEVSEAEEDARLKALIGQD
jgi:hypothetical protein